ncbi:anthranilate phosphoribosyltransferase [Bacteroidota bacterium]
MKDVLNDLFEYKILNEQMAREILKNLAQGAYNNSQVASFLTVYLMRSITVEELQGFREAMLELCVPVEIDEYDPMDLCGTGGDGKDTFNISTLASFIVAGAGQYVAKHGNVGVSSVCGSSNLLVHFGYEFTNETDKLKKSLDKSHICFLHAPLFHPAMKNVAPIRKELGVKTFFNMLGPMVNPSRLQKQLVGVFSLELARLYGYLYQQYGSNYAIIHSLDGYDEISLTGGFRMITKNEEKIIYPEDLGLDVLKNIDLAGGSSVEESARIFMDILELKGTKAQEQVGIANAGMALYISGKYENLDDSISAARESLESRNALKAFKNFINGK